MVVVAPIAVPQPDGDVKLGAAAREPIEADDSDDGNARCFRVPRSLGCR